jgi:hypothetical protein
MYGTTIQQDPNQGSALRDGVWGDILSTASKLVPDGLQAEGQKVLDSITTTAKDAVSSVAGSGITNTLTQAAQSGIDAARSSTGLPATNPERTPVAPTTTAPTTNTATFQIRNKSVMIGAGTTVAMGAFGVYKKVGIVKTVLLSLAGGVSATILAARFIR